jgi:LytR cell envelope-related transcriptional attenuator
VELDEGSALHVANLSDAVDAPLTGPDALIRPWRTATLVASLVAAVELVLLLGAAVLLLAKPLSHAMQHHATAVALAAPKQRDIVAAAKQVVTLPSLTRDETKVFVLNGNGRSGAAAAESSKLQVLGYRVPATGNAPRSDYATTVIMYKPGFRGDALRMAKDLKVKVVGPLDGLKPAALHGAQLAILLGAA